MTDRGWVQCLGITQRGTRCRHAVWEHYGFRTCTMHQNQEGRTVKAKVEWAVPGQLLAITAYEKGDEPEGSVDLPPALINDWQRAELDRHGTINEIVAYLRSTDQEVPS